MYAPSINSGGPSGAFKSHSWLKDFEEGLAAMEFMVPCRGLFVCLRLPGVIAVKVESTPTLVNEVEVPPDDRGLRVACAARWFALLFFCWSGLRMGSCIRRCQARRLPA